MRKLTIAELNFNPRSHERSDPMVKKFLLMKMISIHAPTRGATCNSIRPLCIYEFQSTLPREERHHRCLFYVSNVLFQSTLPREERPCNSIRPLCIYEFQSTLPREERHGTSRINAYQILISIHAPTRGATRRGGQLRYIVYISIHAPTRGATGKNENMSAIIVDFNPRSHERSDAPRLHARPTEAISIHAPTRGATAILHKKFVYFYTIPTINI